MHRRLEVGEHLTHPGGEFRARAPEGVVVVEAVRVVARRHRRLVETVSAAGEALDDVGDLFAGQQLFDGQTHDRQTSPPAHPG